MFNFFSNKTFKNFLNDILRDSQSKKTSLTRILAIVLFIVVIWFHYEAIRLMIEKKEVDHALLLEDFAFISALIMQKNYINRNVKDQEEEPV